MTINPRMRLECKEKNTSSYLYFRVFTFMAYLCRSCSACRACLAASSWASASLTLKIQEPKHRERTFPPRPLWIPQVIPNENNKSQCN